MAGESRLANPSIRVMEVDIVAKNANVLHEKSLTVGQKAADRLASFGGSWPFIGLFALFLTVWILLNSAAPIFHWDGYPFILLNLLLSCLAAIQAPVILMSANRQAQKDRIKSELDYDVNTKAERHIEHVEGELDEIKAMLHQLCPKPESGA